MDILYVALTDWPPVEAEAAEALPRLPRLERLLARAQPGAGPEDWRRWLLQAAGLEAPAGDLPLARALAVAAGLTPDPATSWFIATPVRCRAGHAAVHLEDTVDLDAPALDALVHGFGGEWRDTRWSLRRAGRHLLAVHDGALEVTTSDPAAVRGHDLWSHGPRGPGAPLLRALGSELEMWLHARGAAANGLWLWGGGRGALTGHARWPAGDVPDPYLGAIRATSPGEASDGLQMWQVSVGTRLARGEALVDLDAIAGRIAAHRGPVRLHCGRRLWRLDRADRWRWWRSTRPWWESLA